MAVLQVFASVHTVQVPPVIWMPEQSMLSFDGGVGEADGGGVGGGDGGGRGDAAMQ